LPSIHFPVFLVIESTFLQKFLPGARRASPVAQRALVAMPSLPPRRSGTVVSASFQLSMLPSPSGCGLGLRGILTFEATYAFAYATAWRLAAIPRTTLSIDFRTLVSLNPAIQATGLLAFTPAGLTPAEHASLCWTYMNTPAFAGHTTGLVVFPHPAPHQYSLIHFNRGYKCYV